MKQLAICVCSLDRKPYGHGTVGGFKCRNCGAALRATERTAPRLIMGEMTPFCAACALRLVRGTTAMGKEVEGAGTSPAAMKVLSADSEMFDAWIRGPMAFCGHCGVKIQTLEEAQTHECERTAAP